MVFVKKKNEYGMAAKWILGNKKGRRKKTPPKTKRSENTRKYVKGIRLKICRRAKNYGAIRQAV